jgi:hypothetical protein
MIGAGPLLGLAPLQSPAVTGNQKDISRIGKIRFKSLTWRTHPPRENGYASFDQLFLH